MNKTMYSILQWKHWADKSPCLKPLYVLWLYCSRLHVDMASLSPPLSLSPCLPSPTLPSLGLVFPAALCLPLVQSVHMPGRLLSVVSRCLVPRSATCSMCFAALCPPARAQLWMLHVLLCVSGAHPRSLPQLRHRAAPLASGSATVTLV